MQPCEFLFKVVECDYYMIEVVYAASNIFWLAGTVGSSMLLVL